MDYTVDAVDKAVGLLFLVAQNPGLGVTELAKRSGNTKARAFRLLGTLERSGLVQRGGMSATYSLAYGALYLGAAAQEQISLSRLAKTHLRELGTRCNENVLIRVRDGMDTVCIARWDSAHTVRMHTEIGNRRPLYVGASGKLLLAFSADDIQHQVFTGEITRFTPNTIIDPVKLKREIEKVREQGYSVSFAERTADIVSVAAPIRDATGTVVAAMSVTGPSSRISKDMVDAYVRYLQEGATKFSLELGYLNVGT